MVKAFQIRRHALNRANSLPETQAHSIRGFISGAIGKKMGLAVESAKREDGGRVYAIRS